MLPKKMKRSVEIVAKIAIGNEARAEIIVKMIKKIAKETISEIKEMILGVDIVLNMRSIE